MKLMEKKEGLLDVLREQSKWNEEQRGKDWQAVMINTSAQHYQDIDTLVVLWETKYEDSEKELIETWWMPED